MNLLTTWFLRGEIKKYQYKLQTEKPISWERIIMELNFPAHFLFKISKFGATYEYSSTRFTRVGVLCRTRYITIVAIQWDAKKWTVFPYSFTLDFFQIVKFHEQVLVLVRQVVGFVFCIQHAFMCFSRAV